MGRYVQRISLLPFSAEEMWIGWELEGIDGDIDGLVPVAGLAESEIERLNVLEYQLIPFEYLQDFTRNLR